MFPGWTLGVVGVVGLALLIVADLVLVWTPARELDIFRAAVGKSDRRLVGGALLGVFAIPLVLAGIAFIFRGLAPAGPWWSLPAVLVAAFAYVIGAGFHAVIGPFAIAIRDTAEELRPTSATLASMRRIFDPLRTALWLSIFASSVLVFAAILSGKTLYPQWSAAMSPFPVVIAFRIACKIAPPTISGALVPAGGNLATLIFMIVSLAVLPADL
jgi:hypothetical protein